MFHGMWHIWYLNHMCQHCSCCPWHGLLGSKWQPSVMVFVAFNCQFVTKRIRIQTKTIFNSTLIIVSVRPVKLFWFSSSLNCLTLGRKQEICATHFGTRRSSSFTLLLPSCPWSLLPHVNTSQAPVRAMLWLLPPHTLCTSCAFRVSTHSASATHRLWWKRLRSHGSGTQKCSLSEHYIITLNKSSNNCTVHPQDKCPALSSKASLPVHEKHTYNNTSEN